MLCHLQSFARRPLFELVCGRHQEALADVKAIATFFFDHQIFKKKGLWHAIFKNKRTAHGMLVPVD